MEGEADFHTFDHGPLPDINEEENESLMPEYGTVNIKEFYDNLKRRFGPRWGLAAERLNLIWRKKNPGDPTPPYLVKGTIRKGQMGHREYLRIFKKVKKDFPNARFLRLQFREGPNEQLQVKTWGDMSWMNLYEGDNINRKLPQNVRRALGSKNSPKTATEEEIMKTIRQEYPNASFDLLGLRYGPQDQIQLRYLGKTAKYKGWYDFKVAKDRLNTKLNPSFPEAISKRFGAPNIRIKTENIDSAKKEDEYMGPINKAYEELLDERNKLLIESDHEEEKLRQIDEAIAEYIEEQARLQDTVSDSSRTEEERDAASVELESVREEIDVLETETKGQLRTYFKSYD